MNYARWLLFLVAATNASAQDKNPYDGEWLIKIERNAYRGEADLTITGTDGTYRRRLVGGKDDPCAKREIPITITKATADELEYTIYGSKALAGCPDGQVTMKKAADGTLEGSVSNGAKFKQIKK